MDSNREVSNEHRWHENVSALLAVRLEEKLGQWQIDLLANNRLARLTPRGLVHISCSYDSTDPTESSYSVMEVTEEKMVPTSEMLRGHLYSCDAQREYCVLTIHGSGMVLTSICEDYDLEWLTLNDHYPHLCMQAKR